MHGLPDPTITVMSTILTSGHKPANDLALEALRGLRTDMLYLYPRPPSRGPWLRRVVREIEQINVRPWYFRRRLRQIGYQFRHSIAWPQQAHHELVMGLCEHDPEMAALIEHKQPSTGIIALALGLADDRYDRFVMSGFSFEVTHAYAHNPSIDELGTTRSKHADTDIAVLRRLSDRFGNVVTTEAAVHRLAGIPLMDPPTPVGEPVRARAS
jgi:hypothetical protein